jgi:hypothetical protein
VTGAGLDELKAVLVTRIAPHPPPSGAAVPFTLRQVNALAAARGLIESSQLPSAVQNLAALLRGE